MGDEEIFEKFGYPDDYRTEEQELADYLAALEKEAQNEADSCEWEAFIQDLRKMDLYEIEYEIMKLEEKLKKPLAQLEELKKQKDRLKESTN